LRLKEKAFLVKKNQQKLGGTKLLRVVWFYRKEPKNSSNKLFTLNVVFDDGKIFGKSKDKGVKNRTKVSCLER
jgi:hypothetical protein